MNQQLQKLWERVEAIIIATGSNEEITYAGLQIQRSTFKHPLFCNTDYYVVTDLLSNRTILELHGIKERLEVCRYEKKDYYWNSFISASSKLRCIENSFGLCQKNH